MKKIVLRNVSPDIQRLIEARCEAESLSTEAAVEKILGDAAIEFMVQHDLALLESWEREDQEQSPVAEMTRQHQRCGNLGHLVICCHGSVHLGHC